eukprot:TRINITY_DN76759_c0_g1_i1.p1 TRINITY_DN76759_c0_g1~~TRINITY_DN76759_c0_g1_i1.p1  ORF type:complete len:586 (-),score=93.74 TRINITY_DN76759_c0_g1_i1:100-1785(-)
MAVFGVPKGSASCTSRRRMRAVLPTFVTAFVVSVCALCAFGRSLQGTTFLNGQVTGAVGSHAPSRPSALAFGLSASGVSDWRHTRNNANAASSQPLRSSSPSSASLSLQLQERPTKKVREGKEWGGVSSVLGGIFAHLVLGTLYCWGSFSSYLPPHLRFFDGQLHPGVQPDSINVLPVVFIFQLVGLQLGSRILPKLGPKRTTLMGVLLIAFAVFMASYATTLTTFMAAYAVLFGVGTGIAYMAPIVASWRFFPKRKGLVSGTILAGFGAGGFLFSMVGSSLANPQALQPLAETGLFPESVFQNWPGMLRTLAGCYALLGVCSACLVKERSTKQLLVPMTSVEDADIAERPPPGDVLTVKEAVKSPAFWTLWSTLLLASTAALNTAAMYKLFAFAHPLLADDIFVSFMGGLGAGCNGLGRMFWASLVDTCGVKGPFAALLLMQTVNMLLFPVLSPLSRVAFGVQICLSFFLLGGYFSLAPVINAMIVGQKNAASIYSVLFTAFATASIVGVKLTRVMLPQFGWIGVFRALATLSLVAVGSLAALRLPRKCDIYDDSEFCVV